MTPFIRTWGEGRTLLIHCALAHSGVLGRIAERIPGGAIAFDLPGHGQSPPWDGAGDYHGRCVDWALEALTGRKRPIIGHSLGATVALRLAVHHPDLVTRLTLIEPVYFAALRTGDPEAYRAHLAASQPLVAHHEAGDLMAMAEWFTGHWGGAPFSTLPEKLQKTMAAQMPLIIAQDPGLDGDSGGVLEPGRREARGCPVTLIRGSESQPSVAAIHAVILSRLPNAREFIVAGAGHMA
ncbi:MAG: alpha/beta hydrolase, partial [Pseudomonadota bacterium]